MFISLIILLVVTFIFSTLSIPLALQLTPDHPYYILTFKRSKGRRAKESRPPRRRLELRLSLLSTLPSLFSTTLVFGASVMISSYVYRWTTHSRFDALMVDALSMICATAVVMLCAAYWAAGTHERNGTPEETDSSAKKEWYIPASVVLICALNTVLFATHFSIFYKKGKPIERLCGQRLQKPTLGEESAFHSSSDFQHLLLGFISFALACTGLAFHYPGLRSTRKRLTGCRWALWVAAECLPAAAGSAALAAFAAHYWRTRRVMEEVYGKAFLAAVKRWGFGQYLALATWAQPVLLWLYVYFVDNGVEEGGGEGEVEATELLSLQVETGSPRRWTPPKP
jgi:hypothetical protein